MKVLYDHEIFGIQKYGGASRYFFEVIRNIINYPDIDVSVYAGFFTNEYGLEKYKKDFQKFFGYKYSEIPKTKMAMIKLNGILLPQFLKRVKPDIYHQTYYGNFVKNFKGKRVVTVLDMTHELFKGKGEFSPMDKTSEDKRIAVQNADGIVCISKSTQRDVVEILKVPENKTKVIYLANSLTSNINTKPLVEGNYLLYVAKRKGYKNFRLIVDAFAESKFLQDNFKVVCVGGGPFTSDEKKLMENSKIKDPIYYNANDESLANLYRYSFALVYPSKYEGFGIPPLEAMNYNCPVITVNVSSIPEVVGDAGIYIDPDDPKQLIAAVKKLHSEPDFREDLISKGAKQKLKFSWEKCAAEHLEFYKELLG